MKKELLFILCLATRVWANSYSTSFPATENPISENRHWISGALAGWGNVQTINGLACGTSVIGQYGDPTAVLTGTWGSDQSAQATVRILQPAPLATFQEVELRLRTTMSPGSITGYEVNISVAPANAYCQLVKWDGPLGQFEILKGVNAFAKNGDVLSASVSGDNFTVKLNGDTLFQYADSTYNGGSPGIGFFVQGNSTMTGFGFSSFSASDDGSGVPVPTPIPMPTPTPPISATPTPHDPHNPHDRPAPPRNLRINPN